jgi:hypothetical protein
MKLVIALEASEVERLQKVLESLRRLQGLRDLILERNYKECPSISMLYPALPHSISCLTGLTSLTIKQWQLPQGTCHALCNLSALRSLSLDEVRMPSFAELGASGSNLTKLTSLSLSTRGSPRPYRDFALLSALHNLKELSFGEFDQSLECRELISMRQLPITSCCIDLSLAYSSESDMFKSWLEVSGERLKCLTILGHPQYGPQKMDDAPYRFLLSWLYSYTRPCLQSLCLHIVNLSAASCCDLVRLTQLTSLEIQHPHIAALVVDLRLCQQLCALTGLKRLVLSTSWYGSTHLPAAVAVMAEIQALSGLPRLSSLCVEGWEDAIQAVKDVFGERVVKQEACGEFLLKPLLGNASS